MVKVVLKALWQFCGYSEEPVKGTQIIFSKHGWHESNEYFPPFGSFAHTCLSRNGAKKTEPHKNRDPHK